MHQITERDKSRNKKVGFDRCEPETDIDHVVLVRWNDHVRVVLSLWFFCRKNFGYVTTNLNPPLFFDRKSRFRGEWRPPRDWNFRLTHPETGTATHCEGRLRKNADGSFEFVFSTTDNGFRFLVKCTIIYAMHGDYCKLGIDNVRWVFTGAGTAVDYPIVEGYKKRIVHVRLEIFSKLIFQISSFTSLGDVVLFPDKRKESRAGIHVNLAPMGDRAFLMFQGMDEKRTIRVLIHVWNRNLPSESWDVYFVKDDQINVGQMSEVMIVSVHFFCSVPSRDHFKLFLKK